MMASMMLILPALWALGPQEIVPPGGPALPAEVRQLVRQLGAAQRAERAKAEARLLELGPAVLEHLPPEELLPNASVRAAVERVRVALEERLARESTAASRVTLTGRQSLESWTRLLALQTGNSIEATDLPVDQREHQVDLALDGETFWKALDHIVERANLAYTIDGLAGKLRLVARGKAGEVPAAVCHAGAFRVWAVSAAARPGPGAKPLVRANLVIAPEPRLRVLFMQYAAADQIARTGEGAVLAPFNPEARYDLPLHAGRGESRLQLDFVAPGEVPDRLRLRGQLRVTVAAVTAPVRFGPLDRLAEQKELSIARRKGGVTVTLNRVGRVRSEPAAGGWEVRLSVVYDRGGPAFESHRAWILHNEVYLEHRDGRRIAPAGGADPTFQGDGAVAMNYLFSMVPEDMEAWSFVYLAPTLIVDVPIAYSLESVPVTRLDSTRQTSRNNSP